MARASLNGRSQFDRNWSMSVCTAMVLVMRLSMFLPVTSVSTQDFTALRSTWTSIYQAKLPAKILFSDTKQSFYLCSANSFDIWRGEHHVSICSRRIYVSQNDEKRCTTCRGRIV